MSETSNGAEEAKVVALSAAGTRKASKAARREQLIEATIDTLAAKGFAATTLADVAKAAGLSGGIVNFHFETKDRLLVETLRHLALEYRTNWRTAVAMAGPTSADRLKALLTADFNDVVCTPRTLAAWCAFWAEAPSRPTYLEHCSANDEEYQVTITNLVADLVAEGGYHFAPAPIGRSLGAMMEGLWLDLMTTQGPFSREEALDTVFAALAALFPRHFSPEGLVVGAP